MGMLLSLLLALQLLKSAHSAQYTLKNPLPSIESYGSKFFDVNGDQFFIRGVAYQPGGSSTLTDPLANPTQCRLDAPLLKKLGANLVRVYYVDSTLNHDECMQTLNDAGIYVMAELATPKKSLNRAASQWTLDLYDSYVANMDALAIYDNLLAVDVGNEVVNDLGTASSALYIKAATRDVKAYRDARGYRQFPVGYTNADVSSISPMIQNYLSCGGNSNETVDFFGYNKYSWCDPSSFTISGYNEFIDMTSKSSIPVFFSEEGCNTNKRTFGDQPFIFGPEMDDVLSGTIVYEWSEEGNNYGLVDLASDTGGAPTPGPDYSALSSRWATVSPSSVRRSKYAPSNTTPVCPSSTASGWPIDPSIGPPTIAALQVSTVKRLTTISSSTSPTASNSKSSTKLTRTNASSSASSLSTSPSPPPPPSQSGLSTTTKIALGVSIPLAIILLSLLTFLLLRQLKKRKAALSKYKDIPKEEKPELAGVPVAEVEAKDNQIHVRREELDGRMRVELGSGGREERAPQVWELG